MYVKVIDDNNNEDDSVPELIENNDSIDNE